VLVCGATGFIGRNVTESLAKRSDLDVHAVRFQRPEFACPNVTWHRADLRQPSEVDELLRGVDVVIQAAATTSGSRDIVSRPHIHVTDNAVMNSLLFRAAFERDVSHVIFFSCSIMYQSADVPLSEEDFDSEQEIYPQYFGAGWTKLYCEKMCEFFSRIGKTKYTAVRHSNIYGPHDKFDLDRSHVFGATITKVLSSEDGRIAVWGTGEEERDLLYVGDLVAFVECAMDRQLSAFELVNVGAGNGITVKDLVHRIVAASGRDLEVTHDFSKPTIKTSVALNCVKAKELFGWQPSTDLNDGIRKTLRWWRDNVGTTAGRGA